MPDLVTYDRADGVAIVTMDDGKANVLSPAMLGELDAALDRAEADGAVVLLTGRPGVFSGGFDLGVLTGGGAAAREMVRSGFELSYRMLSYASPIVVACTGHALAMALFLVMSADHRIGAEGDYRIVANEVTLGITMPYAAIEVCRLRLAPAHFQRVVNNAEIYSPSAAVEAGMLDAVVAPAELGDAARQVAATLMGIDRAAHGATKLRTRRAALEAMRAAMAVDVDEMQALIGAS